MRKLIAASLFVLPTLMQAQSSVRAESPKMMAAAAVLTPKTPVFSGIIAPKRITGLDMAEFAGLTQSQPVKVEFTVDTNGVPQDVKVVDAPNAIVAAKAVVAVSKLRYTPGKLNGQAYAFSELVTLAF